MTDSLPQKLVQKLNHSIYLDPALACNTNITQTAHAREHRWNHVSDHSPHVVFSSSSFCISSGPFMICWLAAPAQLGNVKPTVSNATLLVAPFLGWQRCSVVIPATRVATCWALRCFAHLSNSKHGSVGVQLISKGRLRPVCRDSSGGSVCWCGFPATVYGEGLRLSARSAVGFLFRWTDGGTLAAGDHDEKLVNHLGDRPRPQPRPRMHTCGAHDAICVCCRRSPCESLSLRCVASSQSVLERSRL